MEREGAECANVCVLSLTLLSFPNQRQGDTMHSQYIERVLCQEPRRRPDADWLQRHEHKPRENAISAKMMQSLNIE